MIRLLPHINSILKPQLKFKQRLYRIFLVSILGLSGCEQQIQLPPLKPTDTVMALGDSLTYGTGSSSQQDYPSVLQSLIGNSVVNAGVPGDTTRDVLKRLQVELEKSNPTLVLLCIGGNDFLKRLSRAESKDNLRKIISILKSQSRSVVLIAVPEPSILLSDAPMYREIAEETNTPLLDDVLTDLLSDNNLKSDTIHLNGKGYSELAYQINLYMRSIGLIAR